MARISSYRYDSDVNDGDAWIGTESSNRLTRQFTAAAVANYLNIKGKISVSGQMVFRFSEAPTQKGEFTGPNDGDSLNSFTTLSISGTDLSEQQTAKPPEKERLPFRQDEVEEEKPELLGGVEGHLWRS